MAETYSHYQKRRRRLDATYWPARKTEELFWAVFDATDPYD